MESFLVFSPTDDKPNPIALAETLQLHQLFLFGCSSSGAEQVDTGANSAKVRSTLMLGPPVSPSPGQVFLLELSMFTSESWLHTSVQQGGRPWSSRLGGHGSEF